MVWRINKYTKCFKMYGEDTIFQQMNIFFNLHDPSYNSFDIYKLWNSGVNVFNVDVAVHSEEFLTHVKKLLNKAQGYNDPVFYRPMGLAVTMSVRSPVTVDDRVDIIILKDVTTKEDLFDFRDKYPTEKPILIWITTYNIDDMYMILRFSDGIILDVLEEGKVSQDYCCHFLKQCRQVHKPVICYRADIIKEYWDKPNHRLLPIASHSVRQNIDGVFLENDINISRENNSACIYNFVCALDFTEAHFQKKNMVELIRLELEPPLTPPVTAALSANLIALHTGANLLIVFTTLGKSARLISSTQPPCPVLAITTRETTARALHIYKMVYPLWYKEPSSLNWQEEWRRKVKFGTNFALKTRMISPGAKLVVLSPSKEGYGYCNSVQIAAVPFKCYDDTQKLG